jgi:hypothetical protein
MLKLQPFEVCKLQDVCFYWRDCKGLDVKRKSVFTCLFADEIKQGDKEEKKETCELAVCSLSKPDLTRVGCG